jgi:cytochrome oxidase Cu insertion factor (SCO1/SenC/PrrC family)
MVQGKEKQDVNNTADASIDSRRNNKQKLLLIAGLPLIVMLAATLLFRATQSGDINLVDLLGTRNRGDLLSPAQEVAKLDLKDGNGQPMTWATGKHWTVVVPAFDGCNSNCLETLMTTRQVHLALGRDEERVRRVLLLIDAPLSAESAAIIAKEHPHIVIATTTRASVDVLLSSQPAFAPASTAWYLVDPQGWLMMHYGASHVGKDLLTDLKHLLKYSSES